MKTLGSLALRFLICVVTTYIGVTWLGLIGLATTAPIWAVMFTKPILEFFPGLERMVREHAFKEWEGKYYKYENTHLRVWFDGDDARTPADFTSDFEACSTGAEPETRVRRRLSSIRSETS